MENIQLEKVTESGKPAFVNLFNLYHHNRSKFLPDLYPSVDEEGYYDKANTLATLAVSPDKAQSYLIRYMDKIAGLLTFGFSPVVKPGCDYGIVDIFVLNSYRGKGIAASACKQLFKEFPGRYFIEVIENDNNARGFWDKLIAQEGHLIAQTKIEEPLIAYEFETKG